MIRYTLVLLAMLYFSGCSFKTKPNMWQQKVSASFEAYKKDFLKGKDGLAKSDFERAEENAKSSADLKTLAALYLGKCALHISIGKQDTCQKYLDIRDVANCKFLDNYYNFIQKDFQNTSLAIIDETYVDFLKALKKNDIEAASKAVIDIKAPSSKLLAISLLGKNVSREALQSGIDTLSFYGYKKGVMYLLKLYKGKTEDEKEKSLIKKKIRILSE